MKAALFYGVKDIRVWKKCQYQKLGKRIFDPGTFGCDLRDGYADL